MQLVLNFRYLLFIDLLDIVFHLFYIYLYLFGQNFASYIHFLKSTIKKRMLFLKRGNARQIPTIRKQVSIKALISFSLDLLNKQEEEEFKWGSICRIFFDLNVHFKYSGTVLENSMFRSSHHRCSMKKAVLFHRKTPVLESWQVIFGVNKPMACNFIKKETQAQVFSCEFCEISKNTFFYRTPLVAALIA